jgi:hypothetical protein
VTLHARYFLFLLQSEGTTLRRRKVVRLEGLEPPTPRSVVSPGESVKDGEGV